ncbi:MAG TPA: NAD-dependent epimerase/dehydratase family protein [Flavobacteriales bacterium]|nr:NAD-dependent epimerase/dehydratase family protein [Flavobacteriales bacterium]
MGKSLILTGATGFVGSRFAMLNANKYKIQTIPWQQLSGPVPDLAGKEVMVHMAALNHRMDRVPDEEYMKSNFDLTKALAERAKSDGVGHFVFLSTVKVYGEVNIQGKAFTEVDICNPVDAYGKSKLNAENALRSLETDSFIVSIIRCPLVYGPGVKGNMERLISLAKLPLPLGFKGIGNKRTMVFVDNLIALIDRIIELRESGVFLAGDDHPISTAEAVRMLRSAMHKQPNLFRIPAILWNVMGLVAPKLKTRLFDSLMFDNTNTKKQLNFHNLYTTQEGFTSMIRE